jgi:hypothetical protein
MKKFTSFIKKHPWLLAKSLFLVTFFSNILVACLKKSMLVILDLKGKDPNWEPPAPPSPPKPTPRDCQTTLTGLYSPPWLAASFKEPYKYHPVLISRVAYEAKQKALAGINKKPTPPQVVAPEPAPPPVVDACAAPDFSQEKCPCSGPSFGTPIVIDNSPSQSTSVDPALVVTIGNNVSFNPESK